MSQGSSFFRRASAPLYASLFTTTLLACGLLTMSSPAQAEAHDHKGVLQPFKGAPPQVKLSAADETRLAKGKSVRKQAKSEGGGRGMVIQDIHADVKTVWSRITDYAKYPTMVDDVTECSTYKGADISKDVIYARFVIGGFGFSLEYFIKHTFKPKQGYMTWTLDYDKKSELDDSVGYWYVVKHPLKTGWTRVYYSVDVRVGSWVPGLIEDMIADKGLEKATSWVRLESEKAQKKIPPRASTPAKP
ncbi:MAG: hypothetical protein GY822_13545 [Deltaproteobacteria bacterium]|nr:hypothetical protein [Deltaproteobacteria bacterium]